MSTISHVTEPSGMRRLIYRGHGDAYSTVAWSPDGNLLATGGVTGLIHLWNAVTGAGVTTCEEDTTAWVRAVVWSPDGTRLASTVWDGTVQMWEVSSGKLLSRYTGHTGIGLAVAWVPEGTRLASASHDCTAQIWRAQ